MNIQNLLCGKNRFNLSVLLLLLTTLSHAAEYTLPKFEMAVGGARWQVEVLRNKYRLDHVNGVDFAYADQERARVHLLKRSPNSSGVTHYSFFQLVDQNAHGQSGSPLDFVAGEYEGIQADIKVKGSRITVSKNADNKAAWGDGTNQYVTDYLNGSAMWDTLIHFASSHSFRLNEPVALGAIWSFSEATATLVDVKPMWQREVAEFALAGHKGDERCQGRAWFLLEDGRPLQNNWECTSSARQPERTVRLTSLLTRAWQYSDKTISQLSPTPMPQLHPNGPVTGIAYSEPLQRLLILSRSNEGGGNWLTYWDERRRQAIFSKKTTGENLALSPNASLAAISDTQGFITGELQLGDEFKPFGQIVPAFEPTNGVVASGLYHFYPLTLRKDGRLDVWNLGYGKAVGSHQLEDTSHTLLAVAPDGRVISANPQGALSVYRMAIDVSRCKGKVVDGNWCPGAKLKEFSPVRSLTLPLGDSAIVSMTIHPTRELLALTLDDFKVALYNFVTGKFIRLEGNGIQFDPDSDAIITDLGYYDYSGEPVRKWEAVPELRFSHSRLLAPAPKSYVFYQNSGLSVGVLGANSVLMRDMERGEVLGTIEAQTKPSVSLAHAGSTLYSATSDSLIGFDLATLQPVMEQKELRDVKRLLLGNDTLLLEMPMALIAARVTTNGVAAKPVLIEGDISDVALLGNEIVFAEGREVFRFDLDAEKKRVLHKAPKAIRKFASIDGKADTMAFLLQDDSVWLSHTDKIISTTATASSLLLADTEQDVFYVTGLRDDSGRWNREIPLIRKFSFDGKPLLDLEPGWESITAVRLDKHGQLWGGTDDGEILIWDTTTGRRKFRFSAHLDRINDLHLMDDGTMASAANDGVIRIWRTDIAPFDLTHKAFTSANMLGIFDEDINKRRTNLLATLILDKQGGYVVASDDGYYTASPGALNRASFINGNRILDFSQFDLWLNRPDIIAARLAYSNAAQNKLFARMVEFRRSRHPGLPSTSPALDRAPQLTVTAPDAVVTAEDITLSWSASTSSGKLSRLTVEVNGVPMFGVAGKTIKGSKAQGQLKVPLSSGRNNIKVVVGDARGLQSSPFNLVVNRTGNAEKPALYVLTIGVSDYQNDALDLRYADKDARDIGHYYTVNNAFFSQTHVHTLLNREATRENILKAKQFLLQARPDDRVIIFFAGHGFLDDEENYFFGTTDIDPVKPQLKGLSYPELNSLVDGIASRYKLLLLDTCHSGEVTPLEGMTTAQVSEEVKARGFSIKRRAGPPALNFSLEALQSRFADLREATGAIVLSAAGGREYALENSEWNNGVFTASILSGLGGTKADSNRDGKVTTNELRGYVYSEVQRLTKGQQKPTAREINMDVDFELN